MREEELKEFKLHSFEQITTMPTSHSDCQAPWSLNKMHVMINTAVSCCDIDWRPILASSLRCWDNSSLLHGSAATRSHPPTVEHKHVCTVNQIPHQDDWCIWGNCWNGCRTFSWFLTYLVVTACDHTRSDKLSWERPLCLPCTTMKACHGNTHPRD